MLRKISLSGLALMAALVPCSGLAIEAKPSGVVQAVMGLRVGATFDGKAWIGGHFQNFPEVSMSPSHHVGDKLTVYDGPGWESDKVAYRLYLDGRNAIDLFGKKQPDLILDKIGRGVGDYHKEAPWGMDILKVDKSVGAGGLGILQDGKVRQVGAAQDGIVARVTADGPAVAGIKVEDLGLTSAGTAYDLTAQYTIAPGHRETWVTARASKDVPIVAGIEKPSDVDVLYSPKAKHTGWAYIATYGKQSIIGDALGIVVFYRPRDVVATGDDGDTVFIRFKTPHAIHYGLAAAWSQEGGGITNEADFVTYINGVLANCEQRGHC